MFGIGLPELLTILVLATIFLGPEGMVKFAGDLGRWLAKFRRETESVTREFKEAFNLELDTGELKEALDVGIDPKDPLGLKELEREMSAQPGQGRQWNVPASSAMRAPSVAAPSATAPQGDAPYSPAAEAPLSAGAEIATELAPEPATADMSQDAAPVSIGLADWVPDDDKAEAVEIGEPLWVEVDDAVAEHSATNGEAAGAEERA